MSAEDRKRARAARERIRYLVNKLEDFGFSRPERKFLYQMVFGILKVQSLVLMEIARALGERIRAKKTEERLRRNLGRRGLADRLMEVLPKMARPRLGRNAVLVVDLTDIQKPYGEKMEGRRRVWDGSEKRVGEGYWVTTVIGVTGGKWPDREIVPLYGELYSLGYGSEAEDSENKRVWKAIERVTAGVGKSHVWALDRGFDRMDGMIRPLVEGRYRFLIRQVGDRLVEVDGRRQSVREAAQGVGTFQAVEAERVHNGRTRRVRFWIGARLVWVAQARAWLWLVVFRSQEGGESWYLGRLEKHRGTGWEELGAEEAARRAFEVYGKRWAVEELHRHVKNTYRWEGLRVRTYERLRNLTAVFWFAMFFLYTDWEAVKGRLLLDYAQKVTLSGRLKELRGFIYYKVSMIFAFLFSTLVCPLKELARYKWLLSRQGPQFELPLLLE